MRGTTFSVTIPDAYVQQIEELARTLGVSRSAAVRFIIHDYFKVRELIQKHEDQPDVTASTVQS